MCTWCKQFGMQSCDWCGKLVCADYSFGDDIVGALKISNDGESILCDDCYQGYQDDYEAWELEQYDGEELF